MRRGITLIVAAALTVAGCGGDDDGDEPKRPELPAQLASALAVESDRIGESLANGQDCAAHRQAQALRAHVGDAVGSGDVPPALGREMSAAASALADGISCEPTPPQPVEEPEPAPTGCDAIVAQLEQLELQAEQQPGGPLGGELKKELKDQAKALKDQLKEQCDEGDGGEGDGDGHEGDGGGPPGGPPGLGGESPGNSEHSGGGRLEGN